MTNPAEAPAHDKARQLVARLAYRGLLGVTVVSDSLPARIRFGHWQKVLGLLKPRRPLPSVARRATGHTAPPLRLIAADKPQHRCLLVAGALDGGGVEEVVATLALGLPAEGFTVEVVTTRAGRVSDELRAAGVSVIECPTQELAVLIAQRDPDVVELHRPDREFIEAALQSKALVVPVFHAMESYLDAQAWGRLKELVGAAPACIAVSQGVREFFVQRIGASSISVVVNGVAPLNEDSALDRPAARRELATLLGIDVDDDEVLVVALQRFSDQKNAAGLVGAFLKAATLHPRLRLVLAGSADNWLEYRRADLLRKRSPAGARVHLLGDSDPQVILAAGDLYALDSFAEGGPLTAVEAVLHGLPIVVSDVGFARDLVKEEGVVGEVVERANQGFSESDLAAQRRRLRQSNQDEFAAALLRVAAGQRSVAGRVPASFTRKAMVAAHGAVLRAALVTP